MFEYWNIFCFWSTAGNILRRERIYLQKNKSSIFKNNVKVFRDRPFVNSIAKRLHRRYLIGFWTHLLYCLILSVLLLLSTVLKSAYHSSQIVNLISKPVNQISSDVANMEKKLMYWSQHLFQSYVLELPVCLPYPVYISSISSLNVIVELQS